MLLLKGKPQRMTCSCLEKHISYARCAPDPAPGVPDTHARARLFAACPKVLADPGKALGCGRGCAYGKECHMSSGPS